MNWLDEERDLAVSAVRNVHLDCLANAGVPLKAVVKLGEELPPFGVCRTKALPDGAYEPDPAGALCVVMPVTVPAPFAPWGYELETLDTLDLIAFTTDRPAAWRWRIGDGWALGAQYLIEPMDELVRLVATPLEWLAQAGQAVCVLDWSDTSPIWPLLHYGPDLIVDDNALRIRLQAALRRTAPAPRLRRSSDAA